MSQKRNFLLLLVLSILIAACGGAPQPEATSPALPTASPLPSLTFTPDPCGSENLPAEVKKVHDYMREFDDYSALTSNLPQAQVAQFIPEMQKVLRSAQDLAVPACLSDLQEYQLAHMSAVIEILFLFVSAQDVEAMEQVNAGILKARDFHLQYDLERARLLGFTVAPMPTAPPQATVTPKP